MQREKDKVIRWRKKLKMKKKKKYFLFFSIIIFSLINYFLRFRINNYFTKTVNYIL